MANPRDWERVVAVFATGQQWQFKDWLYPNPVDLFQRVVGVHLTMDDRAVDPAILSWNCRVLKVIRMRMVIISMCTTVFL
jgi:parafibromin